MSPITFKIELSPQQVQLIGNALGVSLTELMANIQRQVTQQEQQIATQQAQATNGKQATPYGIQPSPPPIRP